MFALRKITNDGVEINFVLGKSYTLVMAETAPKEFARIKDKEKIFPEEVYGIVSGNNGECIPLYKDQLNFIVSENGITYENLTLRELRRRK